jgi:hypothetical protein
MKDLRDDENYLVSEYVCLLALSGNPDLIAFYVTYLPSDIGMRVFGCNFLSTWMASKSERYALLDKIRIEHPGVELNGACIMAVESRIDEIVQDAERGVIDLSGLHGCVRDGDVIRVLEYCAWGREMYPNLVRSANKLIAYYLKMGMLGDARAVIESLDAKFLGWVGDEVGEKGKVGEVDGDEAKFTGYVGLVENLKVYLELRKDFAGWDGLNSLQKKGAVEVSRELEKKFRKIIYAFAGEEELMRMYVPEIYCLLWEVLYETRDIIPGNLDKSLRLCEDVVDEEDHLDWFRESGQLVRFIALMRKSALATLQVK